MGCLQTKQSYLFLSDNDDIQLEKEKIVVRDDKEIKKMKKTPTSYLTNVIIMNKKVPKFVKLFFKMVNNRDYSDCEYHVNKDIFYFSNFVYTIEFTKKKYLDRRKQLFKRIRQMKHSDNIVVPDGIFYIPIESNMGVIIQKMEYCEGGDMFDFMFDPLKHHNNIHKIVYDLSSTLIELHENDIFLNDIKPENIFVSSTFKFGDIEEAFIDQPFMNEDDYRDTEKRLNFLEKGRRRWVRTLRYCPNRDYPMTRRLAIRNDIYAFIITIAMYICKKVYNREPTIFTEKNLPKTLMYEMKHKIHHVINNEYVDLAVEYIIEHHRINTSVLIELQELAQINIV